MCHISTKDALLFNSGCLKSLALYNSISFRALVNGAVDRVEPIFLLGRRRGSWRPAFLFPKQSPEICMHNTHVPRPFLPSSKRTLQTSICDLQPKLSNRFKFISWPQISTLAHLLIQYSTI